MLRRFNIQQVQVSRGVAQSATRCFSFLPASWASSQQSTSSPSWAFRSSSTSTKSGWLKSSPVALLRAAGGGPSQSNNNNNSSSYNYSSSSVQANYTPQTTNETFSSQSTADSITPQVRNHLVRVYNLLTFGVVTAGIGCAAMITTPLGAIVPYWAAMIGGLGCLLWLNFKPPANPQARVGLFLAFTTLEGMSIAPFVKMGAMKGVLGSALVMTGAVFAGFTAAALLAPRGKLLALGGPIFGMLMGMMALSLVSMFYPTYFAHSILLYGGLALFSVMIAFDTQVMIERARCGNGDHVQDATSLFLNMMNIFIRLLQILGRD